MSQPDTIGVNKDWFNATVSNAVNDPILRRKLLQRLDVMRREAEHTVRAIDAMRGQLKKEKPFPSTPLAFALKQSRDWVLSQVMSEAYVLTMSARFVLTPPPPHFGILFDRAVRQGIAEAVSDPDRKAWIHRNI